MDEKLQVHGGNFQIIRTVEVDNFHTDQELKLIRLQNLSSD